MPPRQVQKQCKDGKTSVLAARRFLKACGKTSAVGNALPPAIANLPSRAALVDQIVVFAKLWGKHNTMSFLALRQATQQLIA
eukprot:11199828-Alexandrium_andersonii.AAC.1